MELKHIKELMAAMGRTGIKKISLKKAEFELQLEREENGAYRSVDLAAEISEESQQHAAQRRLNQAFSRAKDAATPVSGSSGSGTAAAEKEEGTSSIYVTSPMVGTFYAAPSPEDPSFVKIGEKVDKNTVVCIIEAMKVMNEVKAGVSGVLAEVLVESGHPVEFGSKLFRIN